MPGKLFRRSAALHAIACMGSAFLADSALRHGSAFRNCQCCFTCAMIAANSQRIAK